MGVHVLDLNTEGGNFLILTIGMFTLIFLPASLFLQWLLYLIFLKKDFTLEHFNKHSTIDSFSRQYRFIKKGTNDNVE